jgi:hypothetical protein
MVGWLINKEHLSTVTLHAGFNFYKGWFSESLNKYNPVIAEPEESPAQKNYKRNFGDSLIRGFPPKLCICIPYCIMSVTYFSSASPIRIIHSET